MRLYSKLLYVFPVCLTAIGIGIHFFGVLGVFQQEQSRLVHTVLLVVDSLVVFGLLRKSVFGYCLAILLYIEQCIVQPYFAYQRFLQDGSVFGFLVVCPLVLSALVILITNKKLFTIKPSRL